MGENVYKTKAKYCYSYNAFDFSHPHDLQLLVGDTRFLLCKTCGKIYPVTIETK